MTLHCAFNFLLGRDTASPHMKKIAANATIMGQAMALVSALAISRMALLGGAIAVVAGHAVALGQSAIVAAGALALIPAAIAGAVGTAIAGAAAFGGLAEAWKQTGASAVKGGGASVDVAHRVELANRAVRDATQALSDAQRDALDAQQAVTRAREDAAGRLEDLSRSLRGAQLDERGAVESLREARERLAAARSGGDASEIRRAKLSYDEAALSLENVRDRVSDLKKEQEQATAKGVEGSDEVQSALQRQEQSQRQVTAATERLADAQRELAQAGKTAGGGIDKAKQALDNLAPSAAAMVLTLRAMAPAWVAAGKGAQQATWAGVAGDMQTLGAIYLPRVSGWLRRMGEGFNLAIRETLGLAKTNAFARDVGTSLEFIDQTVLRLARSIRPVVNGVMQFVAVGSGFFPGIAANVGSIAERFERWAIAARESGRMQQWITSGLAALGQFWAVAKNVTMTVIAFFKAGENPATLTGLVNATAAMLAWVQSAQGQQAIANMMANLRSLFNSIALILGAVITETGGLADIFSVTVVVAGFLASHLETFRRLLPLLIDLYLAWKIVQLANNAIMLASTVATAASTAAKWVHITATNIMNATLLRTVAAVIAARAAMIAGAVATAAVTAAQWLWNVAMMANPIGLIILAVIAFIAIIIVLIKYHKEIGEFLGFIWGKIWDFLKMIGAWFAGPFLDYFKNAWATLVGLFEQGAAWVMGWVNRFLAPIIAIKDKIAAVGIWQTLVDGFKAAINALIGIWNKMDFSVGPWKIPDWVPLVGGKSFFIPDIFPDIPKLDVGGHVTQTGMALIHKGEDVVPAAETTAFQRSSGSAPRGTLTVRSDGRAAGRALVEILRGAVRDMGGDFDILFEN